MSTNNDFNPNDIGVPNGNFFALPVELEEAEIVLFPVPWDVTTSYKSGTSGGPDAILEASVQVDLFDESIENAWSIPVGTLKTFINTLPSNKQYRELAEDIISRLSDGEAESTLMDQILKVNEASDRLNKFVYENSRSLLERGKIVGVIGGEHSVPLGLIKALGEFYPDFGILHIDAHADLRDAYEGFRYSHASIMFNALNEVPQISRICQVAIRDYCQDEANLIKRDPRLTLYSDLMINNRLFDGEKWSVIVDQIVESLPGYVYISFDVDGLSPEFCPNTGTPVPGGLSFSQADYLLRRLSSSGKTIIGFDLCEVTPAKEGEWDANVGARLAFKLALYTFVNRL